MPVLRDQAHHHYALHISSKWACGMRPPYNPWERAGNMTYMQHTAILLEWVLHDCCLPDELHAHATLDHKTTYEAWFSHRPSISHLHEIRCHAFALIQNNNPKIYQQSSPCILIGYAPNSKACRLWDNFTEKVFNLFHVTFIKHLDTLPCSLLPSTTVELLPSSSPS